MSLTYATQGILFTDLFDALSNLFRVTTELPEQRIIQWFFKSRPAISGADQQLWFRMDRGGVQQSYGAGVYGTRADPVFTVSLETRFAGGSSQIDKARVELHYQNYWRLINVCQAQMLFSNYSAVEVTDGVWLPPIPTVDADEQLAPISCATMSLTEVPGGDKVQQEEWTLTTAFTLVVPCVLKLITRT